MPSNRIRSYTAKKHTDTERQRLAQDLAKAEAHARQPALAAHWAKKLAADLRVFQLKRQIKHHDRRHHLREVAAWDREQRRR
jgi:hypothetical protein